MYSDINSGALPPEGFPIRTSTYQCILTAPRSLSQFSTSFIGSWCQGIHRSLLVALPNMRILLKLAKTLVFTTQTYMFVSLLTYYAIVKVQI